MQNAHQKAGFAKVIALIVIAALVVLAVMYFTSDVAKTRIDAAADQYAHWTPENIAKDPENYLKFCESEANKALQSLKASEIAVAQNRATMETTLTETSNKIGIGEKALSDLKGVFTKAAEAKQWPATWQGRSLEEDAAKRQIVSLHKQVEAQKGLKAKVEQGMKKLDAQVTRIQEGRAETQGQLEEIKTGREMLKVQKLTEDLTTRLASIKGVLQATINTASETSGPVSLEQLTEASVGTVDAAEFDAIMGK
jgi:hypothetical protein